MPAIEYEKRNDLFRSEPHRWRVEDDGIHETVPGKPARLIRWEDVAEMRLQYAPTRFKTWRHVFSLRTAAGERLEIDNVHFRGAADFEDRSAGYAAFVREVLGRVASRFPKKRLSLGAAPLPYFFQVAWMAVAFYFLAMVLLVFPLPVGSAALSVTIKLGVVAFFLPTVMRWAVRSFPRQVRVDDVPESAFPEIKSKK